MDDFTKKLADLNHEEKMRKGRARSKMWSDIWEVATDIIATTIVAVLIVGAIYVLLSQ